MSSNQKQNGDYNGLAKVTQKQYGLSSELNNSSHRQTKENPAKNTNSSNQGVLLLNANQDPVTLSAPLDPSMLLNQGVDLEKDPQQQDMSELSNKQAHLWSTPTGAPKTNLQSNSTVNRTAEFRGTSDSKKNEASQSQTKESEQVFVDPYGQLENGKNQGGFSVIEKGFKQQLNRDSSKKSNNGEKSSQVSKKANSQDNDDQDSENDSHNSSDLSQNQDKMSQSNISGSNSDLNHKKKKISPEIQNDTIEDPNSASKREENQDGEEELEYGDEEEEYGEYDGEEENEAEIDNKDQNEEALEEENLEKEEAKNQAHDSQKDASSHDRDENNEEKSTNNPAAPFGSNILKVGQVQQQSSNSQQLGLQLEIQQSYGRNGQAIPQATASFKQDHLNEEDTNTTRTQKQVQDPVDLPTYESHDKKSRDSPLGTQEALNLKNGNLTISNTALFKNGAQNDQFGENEEFSDSGKVKVKEVVDGDELVPEVEPSGRNTADLLIGHKNKQERLMKKRQDVDGEKYPSKKVIDSHANQGQDSDEKLTNSSASKTTQPQQKPQKESNLEVKRQSNSVNLNLISYQTANFGEYGTMKATGNDAASKGLKRGLNVQPPESNIQNRNQPKSGIQTDLTLISAPQDQMQEDQESDEENLSNFGGKNGKKPPKAEKSAKIEKPSPLVINNNPDEKIDYAEKQSPELQSNKKQNNSPLPQQNMFASMSDINFVAAPQPQPTNQNPPANDNNFQAQNDREESPENQKHSKFSPHHLQKDSQMSHQDREGSSSKNIGGRSTSKNQDSAENQSTKNSKGLGAKVQQNQNISPFGANSSSQQSALQKNANSAPQKEEEGKETELAYQQIISESQKEKMTNMGNNWKVRTQTIDEIHILIQNAIDNEPQVILAQSEALLDFFVSLLNDQNFKIVLMTLSIVNLIIGMPQQIIDEEREDQFLRHPAHFLSSTCLRKHVPRLVNKLSDSKNIIRQQAIRALLGTYLIMHMQSQDNLERQGQVQTDEKSGQNGAKSTQQIIQSPISSKSYNAFGASSINLATNNENTFVLLVLPYLQNSTSWHVREELLNVLIICFLKSKDKIDANDSFDQNKILEVFLKMLDDSKERIRFTALEAIVALVNVSNRSQMLQIIYNLGDQSVSELVNERFKAPAEMSPYLNINGALELPYLEHVELANQVQVDQILQRREGLQSGPAGQIKALSSHPMNNPNQKRGQSSGMNMAQNKQPICPPSANSLSHAAQYAQGAKRTASANNPKFLDPLPHSANIYHQHHQQAALVHQHQHQNQRQTPLQTKHHHLLQHQNHLNHLHMDSNTMHQKTELNRSPLFNVFGGVGPAGFAPSNNEQQNVGNQATNNGSQHQQSATTTAAALSELGGSSGGQQSQPQYGNSIRMNARKSNERLNNSGQSSSFLPSLTKHNSVYGGASGATNSQGQQTNSNSNKQTASGTNQNALASPSNQNLMKNRQLPQSENRFYSQQHSHLQHHQYSGLNSQQNTQKQALLNGSQGGGRLLSGAAESSTSTGGNNVFHQQSSSAALAVQQQTTGGGGSSGLQRRISANSHGQHLTSSSGAAGMGQGPNRFLIQNTLSSHPINQLKQESHKHNQTNQQHPPSASNNSGRQQAAMSPLMPPAADSLSLHTYTNPNLSSQQQQKQQQVGTIGRGGPHADTVGKNLTKNLMNMRNQNGVAGVEGGMGGIMMGNDGVQSEMNYLVNNNNSQTPGVITSGDFLDGQLSEHTPGDHFFTSMGIEPSQSTFSKNNSNNMPQKQNQHLFALQSQQRQLSSNNNANPNPNLNHQHAQIQNQFGNMTPNSAVSPGGANQKAVTGFQGASSNLIPFDQQSTYSYNSRKQMDSQGGCGGEVGGINQKGGRFSHKTLNQNDLVAAFDHPNSQFGGSDQVHMHQQQVFQTPNPQSRGGINGPQRGGNNMALASHLTPSQNSNPNPNFNINHLHPTQSSNQAQNPHPNQMTQLNSQKKVIRGYGQQQMSSHTNHLHYQGGDGGTFYSDGGASMMTKTTGVTNTHSTPNQHQQHQQQQVRIQRTGSKQIASHQSENPNNQQDTTVQQQVVEDQLQNQMKPGQQLGVTNVMGVQRGPVKAIRQAVLRSETSQQSLNSGSQLSQQRGQRQAVGKTRGQHDNDSKLSSQNQHQQLFIDNTKSGQEREQGSNNQNNIVVTGGQGGNDSTQQDQKQFNQRQTLNKAQLMQMQQMQGANNHSLINQNSDLSEFMNNYSIPPHNNAPPPSDHPHHLALGNQQHSQITQRTNPLIQQQASKENQRKSNFTMLSSSSTQQQNAKNLHENTTAENNNNNAFAGDDGSSNFGQNNQAQAQAPAPAKVYLTSGELDPISPNAAKKFKSALHELLQSADWNVQFDSCTVVRRACKHHSELILQHGATLHSLIKQLTKLADSLRSSLAKQALMTVRDMFTYLKRCMESYLDPLIRILLKKASDTNTFIAEEAEQALLAMTTHCNDSKVLHSLLSNQGTNSKSNNQRLRLCRCLEQLAIGLGNNILFFKDSDKLICQLANYIKDASQDVRTSAKRAFISMNQSVMGQNDFEKLLQRVLNEGQYKKVRSFLDTEGKNPSSEYFMQSRLPRPDIVIKTAAVPNSQQLLPLAGAQQSMSTNFGIQGSSTGQSRSHANQSTQENPTPSSITNTSSALGGMGIGVAGNATSSTMGGGVNGGNFSRDLAVSNSGYFGQSQQTAGGTMAGRDNQVIALGQHATSKIRAMGAARGTLRTGPMSSTMQQQKLQRETQNSQLMIGGSNKNPTSHLHHYGAADSATMEMQANSSQALSGGQQAAPNLNIKATQIVNPAKIVRARGRPNLKTKMSFQSSSSLHNAATSQQQQHSATNSKTSLRESQALSSTNHNNAAP